MEGYEPEERTLADAEQTEADIVELHPKNKPETREVEAREAFFERLQSAQTFKRIEWLLEEYMFDVGADADEKVTLKNGFGGSFSVSALLEEVRAADLANGEDADLYLCSQVEPLHQAIERLRAGRIHIREMYEAPDLIPVSEGASGEDNIMNVHTIDMHEDMHEQREQLDIEPAAGPPIMVVGGCNDTLIPAQRMGESLAERGHDVMTLKVATKATAIDERFEFPADTPECVAVQASAILNSAEYASENRFTQHQADYSPQQYDAVGYSFGAINLVTAALADPKRFRKITLYNPAGIHDPSLDAQAREARIKAGMQQSVRQTFQLSREEPLMRELLAEKKEPPFDNDLQATVDMAEAAVATDLIPMITELEEQGVEVEIVASTEDSLCPVSGIRAATEEHGIPVYEIPGTHNSQIQNPALAAEVVEDIFETSESLDTPTNEAAIHALQAGRLAEFDFHQERFERMAQKYNEKLWSRLLPAWPEHRLEAKDFAHEEALRDHEDFEKRQSAEYKQWEAMLETVVERIKLKAENPEAHEDINITLVAMGGGMQGAYSAGQAIGLHESGIGPEVFTNIIGISAGSGTVSFYVTGPDGTRRGASIFYEECTTDKFINLMNALRSGKPIMDVGTLTETWMGEGEKALDEEAVRNCPANVQFAVTEMPKHGERAKSIFIDGKPEPRRGMRASKSVKFASGEPPPINGRQVYDGALDPLPIKKIIDEQQPTDILILPNIPFEHMDAIKPKWYELGLASVAKFIGTADRFASARQLEKFLMNKQRIREEFERIREETGVNIGVLFPPPGGLHAVSKDRDAIKSVISESARGVIRLFKKPQPHDLKLYESEAFKQAA